MCMYVWTKLIALLALNHISDNTSYVVKQKLHKSIDIRCRKIDQSSDVCDDSDVWGGGGGGNKKIVIVSTEQGSASVVSSRDGSNFCIINSNK